MLNFYQAWKDDKERDTKPKKKIGNQTCRVCGKKLFELKQHVVAVHGGEDAWKAYVAAEYAEWEAIRETFLKNFNTFKQKVESPSSH